MFKAEADEDESPPENSWIVDDEGDVVFVDIFWIP